MTEAEIMGLIAGVVGLVLCLAFGLGELVGDLARRAARPWQGWRKPTSRCAASTCESRPWRWCRYGHCLDHCRKYEPPKCNCPLPPMSAAATAQPAEPTDIDGKVW